MTILPDAEPLIERLGDQLEALLEDRGVAEPLLVGILTGGLWVAERLSARLGLETSVGALDVGFHRDDFDARGLPERIRPTRLTGIVEGRDVVLTDDVLHSGRTIRAAINAIFEYGRPRSILLAVLVDRGGRQLPIQADLVGGHLEMPDDRRLKLSGPEPLALTLEEVQG